MTINGFITWEILRDYTTFVAIVFMITQVIKELPKIKVVPTQFLSIIISFVLIIFVNIQAGKFDFLDIVIYLISALFISFTANGAYNGTIKLKEKQDNSNNGGNSNVN